jgi:hypothetical protein
MTKAYLHNKLSKYYTLKQSSSVPFKNEVVLVDEKTPLVSVPKQVGDIKKKETPSIFNNYGQVKFIFTEDGYTILASLMFVGRGIEYVAT